MSCSEALRNGIEWGCRGALIGGTGGRDRASSTQAVAGQLDAVGVVNETVEDGVGIGWVADHGVPFVDRDLAGEDGRAAAVAILEGLKAPIIEDQQLDAGEAAQDPSVAAVAAS